MYQPMSAIESPAFPDLSLTYAASTFLPANTARVSIRVTENAQDSPPTPSHAAHHAHGVFPGQSGHPGFDCEGQR
ncbi:hypothetical protein N7457_001530 [Penicillium paradoxum]|uniref:uncharacterized protein n=1 Tax=Penicillium paradoxum TaxID=176176 RepID=UPI002547317D|nr:uncharacterized protein N7457_001530 [Penicillium paradoxum]KAJ5794931.1 hypothetical protein N7457_001530 [Penicillium paradoxum]